MSPLSFLAVYYGGHLNEKILCTAALTALMASGASAASVDLKGWTENGHLGSQSAGNWAVSGANDTVTQSVNGEPTVFFEPGTNAQGTSISGTIVSTGSDDDYYGFVLGYQDSELNGPADFWLLDWKQADQTFNGVTAKVGLSLSHVTGDQSTTDALDFWGHSGSVNEVARASNLGSTGWVRGQEYKFDLTFTDSLIEVFVDDVLEISYSGNFTDGAYGFYNYSQGPVTYAGVSNAVLPPVNAVPLPAGLPLLLAGLGVFGLLRRARA